MRRAPAVLVAGLSSAVAGPPAQAGDRLHYTLPEGTKVGSQQETAELSLTEYIPEGESVEQWTNMLSVLQMARSAAPDLDSLFKQMQAAFARGCAVEPYIGPPHRFLEGSHPAGIQLALCGRTRRFGTAEALIYKAIEGTSAFYQVQRAWRMPPVDDSTALMPTPEVLSATLTRLESVFLCEAGTQDERCLEAGD